MFLMKVMAGCTLICLMSCTNLVQSDSEIVLCPGDAIMATKNTSKLTVTAINDVTRRYKIDGFDETLNLRPRPMRWFGSLGIYSPSGINGVHMVLEEGQQFFSSEEDALHWISIMPGSRKNFNLVSSSNGVVVGWVKENDILLVQVWQVYIDGKIPVYFSGSNDAKITVDRTHHGDNTCPKKGTFIANKPRVIKGRMYSGRAIDILLEKDVSPAHIEEIIKYGDSYKRLNKILIITHKGVFPFVVTLSNEGKVLSLN